MKKSVKIVLKTIFIIEVLISIGIFICIPIIGESSRTRNLNNDDYYVNVSQNDCYYVVTLSPKVDIQECVVKVILYDKDN